MNSHRSLLVLCSLLCAASAPAAITIIPADSAPLQLAAAEIQRAANASGSSAPNLTLQVEPGVLQAYRITRDGGALRVIGGDAIGAMYGGLDVAEAIRTGALNSLKDSDLTPHIAERGIKFNSPLDARTPTYSGFPDSARLNVGEMWSMNFWRETFDDMAATATTSFRIGVSIPSPAS